MKPFRLNVCADDIDNLFLIRIRKHENMKITFHGKRAESYKFGNLSKIKWPI
jgi:hypothetical protein